MYEKLKKELNTISFYSKMEFLLEVAEIGNVDADMEKAINYLEDALFFAEEQI